MTSPSTLKLDGRELALYQAGAIAGRIQNMVEMVGRVRQLSAGVEKALANAFGPKKKHRAAAEQVSGWFCGTLEVFVRELEAEVENQRKELVRLLDSVDRLAPKTAAPGPRRGGILRRLQGG